MAMRRTCVALSPKLRMNSHPKNAVRWKPGTPGFWKPHYGASKFKWQFTLPYVREVDSLIHYPEVSRITGKPIDWYHDEPEDGYEGLRMLGENTLELRGMPMGRTPEYMQERLRRFFSKFGPVKQCRAEPHSRDPYQCDGRAWVTFRDKHAALKALRAPLKFPASLHDKVISMRHLDTDKRNDPDYFEKSKFWNAQVLSLARQLHMQLSSEAELRENGKLVALISNGLMEHELVILPKPTEPVRGRGGVPPSRGLAGSPTRLVPAGAAVLRRFGSWEALLTEAPFDELFVLERRGAASEGTSEGEATTLVVLPRLASATHRTRILRRGQAVLASRLQAELSVWWREGKVALPEYVQRRIDWQDHKPKLPFELQIMSRSKDRVRIFDEKFLYRRQLVRARNEKRKERRGEWAEERKKMQDEKLESQKRRRDKAVAALDSQKCSGLMGRSPGLVSSSLQRRAR